ncbi:MAG: CDC48 family AAA ATPase [Candidatus Woesearchaeota archaeon]|nr:CDC48 family AAA ATPase [Candidatus Woesearchaeota archaeon]
MPKILNLKVAEAIQDDVNKGIVRIDSQLMNEIGVKSGDIVEISGERPTVGIADRAYPGDIGLNIVRMDGILRRNAKTSISEIVKVKKIEIAEAKRIVIAPARKGIRITAPPNTFRQSLLGRAVVKGDIISLGGARRRYHPLSGHSLVDEMVNSLEESMFGFPFGDLKFVIVETNPKKPIIITDLTEVVLSPQAVQIKEDEAFPEIAYEDIGGLSEEIKKIREMVELPLKHPEIFERLGIEPPKGILLYGPPGTGKTLLAKAVANETSAHFVLINGPEVMSKFYGQSEENLRKKFEEAEKNAPSIIFIDEIDAVAIKREESRGEVERRVVAQLLALMDGLKSRGKVIVIAATNLPDQIDGALRRPGRFDREIEIGVPDKEGRLNILKIHTRNMPILGSLYTDSLLTSIKDKIKQKEGEVKEKIKRDTEQIDALKKNNKLVDILILAKKEELNTIKSKIEELEEQKKKADPTVIYKVVEALRVLTKEYATASAEIKKREDQIAEETNKNKALLEEIHLTETNIARLKKLWNDEKAVLKAVEKIKNVEDARREYLPTDPRLMVIENTCTDDEHYQVLEACKLYGISVDDARREGAKEDLREIAGVTHGFVGADVAALAKETAMIVLRKVLPDLKLSEEEEISKEVLEKLKITKEDFMEALKVVHPSAMREVLVEVPNITWDDIGGHEDVKQELKEAVEWPLKHAEAFQRLGIRPPRGILLYGPPGAGKTLLAKAVANESEANFILVKGPELLSQWVGESEKAVRNVFKRARQTSPTIIFFDEIDALAPMRGANSDSHVTERVVNQLLTEMDGLEELKDVIVVAATNRPDILDTALLRPGRFDRIILTKIPDEDMRKKIFSVHTKKMPLGKDVVIDVLAKKTENYVGADIEAVCREAAILSLRKDMNAAEVPMASFEEALKKVKPSVTPDIEKAYEELQDKFKAARGKQMIAERPSYFG